MFRSLKKFLSGDVLPPLESYDIEKRPRKEIEVRGSRSTDAKVVNGKGMRDFVDADGSIVTEIGKQRPATSSAVSLDKFDLACLDFVVGVKWKRDQDRAIIFKWHWLNGDSAAQIEKAHIEKGTGKLERGYSERTAAEYITAFYDADDEREKSKLVRLRPPRAAQSMSGNVIEW